MDENFLDNRALCVGCGREFEASIEEVFDEVARKYVKRSPEYCPNCEMDRAGDDFDGPDVEDVL